MEQPPSSALSSYVPNPKPDVYPTGLSKLKSLASDTSIWKPNGEKDNVKLSLFYEANASLPTTRGDGAIAGNYTIEQVLSVIASTGCRTVWDARFDKGFPLERYSRIQAKFYAAQKGAGWLVWGRDFVGISGHVQESNEGETMTTYYLQKSAQYDDVPDVHGLVRGELVVGGWVLKESVTSQGTIDVVYIVNVDPKGSLPSSVVSKVAQETPLCIDKVRCYLRDYGYPPHIQQHTPFPGTIQRETLENDRKSFYVDWRPDSATNSFTIYYDSKHWKSGAKVKGREGTEVERDVKVVYEEGKIILTAQEVAVGKDLKVLVERA